MYGVKVMSGAFTDDNYNSNDSEIDGIEKESGSYQSRCRNIHVIFVLKVGLAIKMENSNLFSNILLTFVLATTVMS